MTTIPQNHELLKHLTRLLQAHRLFFRQEQNNGAGRILSPDIGSYQQSELASVPTPPGGRQWGSTRT